MDYLKLEHCSHALSHRPAFSRTTELQDAPIQRWSLCPKKLCLFGVKIYACVYIAPLFRKIKKAYLDTLLTHTQYYSIKPTFLDIFRIFLSIVRRKNSYEPVHSASLSPCYYKVCQRIDRRADIHESKMQDISTQIAYETVVSSVRVSPSVSTQLITILSPSLPPLNLNEK